MKLAIKGGKAFIDPKYRNFKHPNITQDCKIAILKQLDEDISIYDNGGVYRKFEERFCELFKFNGRVLGVNSGTTALYSMFYGLDLKPGDEVIVPSYTFFATATPLLHFGVTVKFADSLDNGNIDPDKVAELITSKTKAIVITHMCGIPCDMEDLLLLSRKHDVMLLEDSSHAHGALYNSKYIGTFSDGSAWSFQGKKILTCGEGGVFATKHQTMFERAVLVGHFNKRAKLEVHQDELAKFKVTGLGLNLRMHPFAAALGLHQMLNAQEMLRDRREVANFYNKEISEIEGLDSVRIPMGADPAWYAYPIKYNEKVVGVSIDKFIKALCAEGALEADIPGSTCPLNNYKIFENPISVSHLYDRSRIRFSDFTNSKYFLEAHKFHNSMFKIPTFYGNDKIDFATSYIEAIKKVIKNIHEIN